MASSDYDIVDIPIEKLVLDQKNPRLFEPDDVPSTVLDLLYEQQVSSGNKLLNLARNIAEHGLNVDQNPIISNNSNDTYIVREGNRRIAAIQLATEVIPFPEEFKELKDSFVIFKDNMPKTVRCAIINDQNEVNRLLLQRHTGTNNGVGVEPWSSEQKERFQAASSGKPSMSMQIIEIIKETFGGDSEELRITVSKIKNTNLHRFFSFADVKNRLGISKKGNTLLYNGKHNELFSNVLKELTGKPVSSIYHKEDAIQLLDKAARYTESENDPTEQMHINNVPTPQVAQEQSTPYELTKCKDEDTVTPSTRPKGYAANRTTVIPQYGNPLDTSSSSKIDEVYKELKKISAIENPIGCGLLLRSLIELSTDYYLIKKIGDAKWNKLKSLSQRLSKTCELLVQDNNSHVNNNDVDYLRKMAANNDGEAIVTLTSLNACTHGQTGYPKGEDLIKTFDRIYGVIKAMLSVN